MTVEFNVFTHFLDAWSGDFLDGRDWKTDVVPWFTDVLGYRPTSKHDGEITTLTFESEADAMLFKLRWL